MPSLFLGAIAVSRTPSYDVRNDDWPDMFAGPSKDRHPLLARQSQQVANLLGATKNLFDLSAVPAQWNLDPMPTGC